MLVLGRVSGLDELHEIGRGCFDIDVSNFEFAEGVLDLLSQDFFRFVVFHGHLLSFESYAGLDVSSQFQWRVNSRHL